MSYKYPIRKDGKTFFPSSRTVFVSAGVRLSSCMLCCCRFPTLTCDICCYGT